MLTKTPGLLIYVLVREAMDFIFDSPKSKQDNDGIWTVIDQLSKQAYFIPMKKTIKVDHRSQVFRHHGERQWSKDYKVILEDIIWWHGWVAKFLIFVSPSNGRAKRIPNSIFFNLLLKWRVAEQKSEWKSSPSWAAYNSTMRSSTGKACFENIYGKVILPPILGTRQDIC